MREFYGTEAPLEGETEAARIVEMVRIRGFAELPNLLEPGQVEEYCERLDAVYARQETELGRPALEAIGEADLARCLLAYDPTFVELARLPRALEIIRALVGDYLLLHLQNGIIVHPHKVHHQSAWHRDLPYQEFVSSRPLAVNIFVCLERFTAETGGTLFLPYSHRSETLPSRGTMDAMEEQPEIPAGSAIVFDSMLFHRSGHNRSDRVRRGINHVYTTGILRQQIDLPRSLEAHAPQLHARASEDPELGRLLGYDARTADNVLAFRNRRLERVRTYRKA